MLGDNISVEFDQFAIASSRVHKSKESWVFGPISSDEFYSSFHGLIYLSLWMWISDWSLVIISFQHVQAEDSPNGMHIFQGHYAIDEH